MLALEKVLLSASGLNLSGTVQDQIEFTTPGTFSFVVPALVTELNAVCIGGGGAGASNVNDGGGGGGGSLQYRNSIPVTAGETLTIVVGNGGQEGSANASSGGASGIFRGGTQLVYAAGGNGARGTYGGAGGAASINAAAQIPYSPLGNSNLSSVDGVLSVVTADNVDDTFYQINLPFTIYFLGVAYNSIFVGSNAYITFAAGSSMFSEYLPSHPPGPHVLIYPADRRLFRLFSGRFNAGTSDDKFVIRQHGGDYGNQSRTNIWEAHFYPNANYFDIFFIVEPGGNAVTPAISNGSTYLTSYASTAGTAVRISTVNPSVTGVGGFGGGAGGSGSQAFGENYLAGGGGGASGYTANGGNAGNGSNSAGQPGIGGGGGGGNADDSLARGGGGTGLKGIGNDGTANGGGGSSYNGTNTALAAAINTQVDLFPVDLHYAWGGFMNRYGVWLSDRGLTDDNIATVNRVFYAPYSGSYTIEYAADNQLNFYIDGVSVAFTSDYTSSATVTKVMTLGSHVLRFDVRNHSGGSWYDNPAGWALTIRDSSGVLLWDTRTFRLASAVNSSTGVIAGGVDTTSQHGGQFGGGGGGRDIDVGDGNGGGGGRGGVRLIWGQGRSYPYRAGDVIPRRIATALNLILHYDAANLDSYSGGSTVYDISGNANHGSIVLGYAPAVPPMLGDNKVLRFPAWSNTKINFNANELTSPRITVEMWAYVDDFAGGMFFGWNIHDVWTQGGTLGFNTGNGDVYGISAARINALNIRDRWAHYVFVMVAGDYNQNKIYINGVEESLGQQYSQQITGNTNFNSGVGRIGGWRLDNSYQQVMDVGIFKIFNRQLTQVEIATLYNENRARFGSAVSQTGAVLLLDAGDTASYPGSGTTWFDLSGGNNHAEINVGGLYNADFEYTSSYGGAIRFLNVAGRGAGRAVGNTNSIEGTNVARSDLTCEVWFYLDTHPIGGNDWVRIFGKGVIPPDNLRYIPYSRTFGLWYHAGYGYVLYQQLSSPGGLVVYDGTNPPGGWGSLATLNTGIRTGVWYHMVGTTVGNTHSLYINGSLVQSEVSAVRGDAVNFGYTVADAGFHEDHNGLVSIVRLYNRGFNAAQVAQSYNQDKGRYTDALAEPGLGTLTVTPVFEPAGGIGDFN